MRPCVARVLFAANSSHPVLIFRYPRFRWNVVSAAQINWGGTTYPAWTSRGSGHAYRYTVTWGPEPASATPPPTPPPTRPPQRAPTLPPSRPIPPTAQTTTRPHTRSPTRRPTVRPGQLPPTQPPTQPPVPTSNAAFTVTAGAEFCQPVGTSCVHDGVGDHGNNEACTVRVVNAGTLTATAFDTESDYDWVTIGTTRYEGSTGPNLVPVSAGETFSWRSDGSAVNAGWTICWAAGFPVPPPTRPPTRPPTPHPEPTRPPTRPPTRAEPTRPPTRPPTHTPPTRIWPGAAGFRPPTRSPTVPPPTATAAEVTPPPTQPPTGPPSQPPSEAVLDEITLAPATTAPSAAPDSDAGAACRCRDNSVDENAAIGLVKRSTGLGFSCCELARYCDNTQYRALVQCACPKSCDSYRPSCPADPSPLTRHPTPAAASVSGGSSAGIDWRQRATLRAVGNQGGCGSCWAFAATHVMQVSPTHPPLPLN